MSYPVKGRLAMSLRACLHKVESNDEQNSDVSSFSHRQLRAKSKATMQAGK
jgi:hypothetical protein